LSRPRLTAQVTAVSALTDPQRQVMWSLMSAYYADVDLAAFHQDLNRKDDVILLSDAADGSLRGFSTLVTYTGEALGRSYRAVFSGDTIIDARYWGQRALQRAFVRYMATQKLRAPMVPLFWLLITKGYKTYLLMTRNFPQHWPAHGWPLPAWEARVRHDLSVKLFGDDWLPERGIIHHHRPLGRLREGVAPIDADLLTSDPDVRFFNAHNPSHALGDELVCLAAFDAHMAWHFIRRQLRRAPARPSPPCTQSAP
jgi:hypothetical protein